MTARRSRSLTNLAQSCHIIPCQYTRYTTDVDYIPESYRVASTTSSAGCLDHTFDMVPCHVKGAVEADCLLLEQDHRQQDKEPSNGKAASTILGARSSFRRALRHQSTYRFVRSVSTRPSGVKIPTTIPRMGYRLKMRMSSSMTSSSSSLYRKSPVLGRIMA